MANISLGGLGSSAFRGGDKVQFIGSSTGLAVSTRLLTSASGRETDVSNTSGWNSSVARYDLEYVRGGGEREE
jgi:hypothetical protein